MAISSKQVREVEFRERMRGYHQDDVDEFLEQVARGIDVLEMQLQEAKAKLARYEANPPIVTKTTSVPATEGRVVSSNASEPSSSGNDLIQRTLLLAQKAADQAVEEAKQEAERIQEEAKRRSDELIEQANRKANQLVEERARVLANEVSSLEQRRSSLVEEIRTLAASVSTAKEEMRASLLDLVSRLESSLDIPLDSTLSAVSASPNEESEVKDAFVEEQFQGSLLDTENKDRGSNHSYDIGTSEFSRLRDDDTVIFPVTDSQNLQDATVTDADFSFGRPSFHLLDGDGPSAPVLFDDEDL